jgi:hypothetical protein
LKPVAVGQDGQYDPIPKQANNQLDHGERGRIALNRLVGPHKGLARLKLLLQQSLKLEVDL